MHLGLQRGMCCSCAVREPCTHAGPAASLSKGYVPLGADAQVMSGTPVWVRKWSPIAPLMPVPSCHRLAAGTVTAEGGMGHVLFMGGQTRQSQMRAQLLVLTSALAGTENMVVVNCSCESA